MYVFILSNPFLSSHMYSLWETAHASLCYVQVPSWRAQPGIAKMPEVKVDVGHREARSGSERPEFTLQGWHQRRSRWTAEPGPRQDWVFCVSICRRLTLAAFLIFSQQSGYVTLCLAVTFLRQWCSAHCSVESTLGQGSYPV